MIIGIISIILSTLCLLALVVLMLKMPKGASFDSEEIQRKLEENSKFQTGLARELNTMLLQSIGQSNIEVRQSIENNLSKIREDNEKKLEQMRQTVDEKLNVSLQSRLSQSFNVINNQLQSVYQSIGEMKQLANSVGDLKRVLNNVKTRGTWGEIQLGVLLEQILTSNQYYTQVNINPKNLERVDFAVRMPGKKDDSEVLLPIDAKFPLEDYQRLIEASERGSKEEVELAVKAIEKKVKEEAKDIKNKYIMIPKTTDFAILYLPIEGLYAEVLRIPKLVEELQQQYKIIVCGPTTIAALLNSLQLGFKSLSIEKRSSEVWTLLATFKHEFNNFVDLLAKTQKKLAETSNIIEDATRKTRTIQRKLKNVTEENEIDNEQEAIEELELHTEDFDE